MTSGPKTEHTAVGGARSAGVPTLPRLLREFQVELLDTAPVHVRAVVDAQLARVGTMLDATRSTMWRVEVDGEAVTAEFEWFRSPLGPLRNQRYELDRFPLPMATLLGGGPTVVLDDSSSQFFGTAEVLVVPVTGRGRLLRFLTIGWSEVDQQAEPAPLRLDPAVLDTLYSLTSVVHAATETAALSERASYDEVSGLANRRLLLFMLNHLLSRLGRSGRGGVGVVFCEIAPEAVPDEVVVRVAKAFQQLTRATDVVGRFDDKMLAVLCDDLRDPGEAVEVARRLSHACRQLGPEAGVLAPCFGVGFSEESVATGVLLRRADLATYQARIDGIGAIRVVSS